MTETAPETPTVGSHDGSDDTAPPEKKYTRQQFTCYMADGRTLVVVSGNPDTLRWETTAARRFPELVPTTDDKGNMSFKAPMFMQTFVAWAALKRTRQYDGTWEQFSETDCLDVTPEEIEVNPTQPAPALG
jgi:hypothetical protein